jgi:hypothetical protein
MKGKDQIKEVAQETKWENDMKKKGGISAPEITSDLNWVPRCSE